MTNIFLQSREGDKHTPFQILPTSWTEYEYFLDIANFIPSRSSSFSKSWVRSSHLFSPNPAINFFNINQLQNVLVLPRLSELSKIIFTSEEDIINEFDKKTTKNQKTIVLTGEDKLEFMKYKENILYHNLKLHSKETIIQRLNQDFIKLYAENKLLDLNGNIIENDISKYKKKSFLDGVNINNNLLSKSNEIVYAVLRNKLNKFNNVPIEKQPYTETIYTNNVKMAYEILTEKTLDYVLRMIEVNYEDIYSEINEEIINGCKKFLINMTKLKDKEKKKEYYALKKKFKSEISQYNYEVSLVVPCVNDTVKGILLEHFLAERPNLDRNKLRRLINQVAQGGRRIEFDPRDGRDYYDVINELANTRLMENTFLTSLIGLYSSRTTTPVLKTETAPSIIFHKIRTMMATTGIPPAGSLLSHSNLTMSGQFNSLKEELSSAIPESYMNFIEDNRFKLTIYSDIPVELALLTNGLSLCQAYPVTRIPITPMHKLMTFYNVTNRGILELSFNKNEVLVLNSIDKEDTIYEEYSLFKEVCHKQGLNFTFVDVSSSDEFIDMINSKESEIVVYYGHATYDIITDTGYLVFSDDKLSYTDLSKLTWVPPVLFLIGCETGSCAAYSRGLSHAFLEKGVKSVLATLFPILADHAALFVGRTLAFIDDPGTDRKSSIATYVNASRKLGWQYDTLSALLNSDVINNEERIEISKEATEVLMRLTYERNRSPPLDEAISIPEGLFVERGIMDDYVRIKDEIINYSLFFTLLGDGHRVII